MSLTDSIALPLPTIKSLETANLRRVLFLFFFFTKIVSNEEIFISDSVSIKINYDIFNMPLSQRNSDSAEAGK